LDGALKSSSSSTFLLGGFRNVAETYHLAVFTHPLRRAIRAVLAGLSMFHYVPKHASWLNMVEIEIGVLRSQCLDRRIAERDRLVAEIAAWERQRNAAGARVKWMFTTETRACELVRCPTHTARLEQFGPNRPDRMLLSFRELITSAFYR
jgi:hypothetical protein